MKSWLQQNNNKKKVVKLLPLVLFWLLLNYFVIHSPPRIFSAPEVLPLGKVLSQPSDATVATDLNEDHWQSVELPDDWSRRETDHSQRWYRGEADVDPKESATWAVYLPFVVHNAALYINGVWIGQSGEFDAPLSRHHNEPLLFRFSSNLLQAGRNTVDIRVKAAYHKQGYLADIYLAPEADLKPHWQYKHFVRVQFIEWVTVVMFVFSAVIFIFWLARPQDQVYGIFALELFFWGMHNLNLFVSEIPVSSRLWEAMTMSTLGWTVITMIFFNHRFVGGGSRLVERACLVFALLGVVILLLPDIGLILEVGYRMWDGFLLVFGFYALVHLLTVYWRNGETDVYLMMLAGIPILVFGLHDILLVNHFIDRQEGLVIQYSVIPAVLLFSWFLLRRFVRSINQAENLAATLEQRVADNRHKIHQQYEQLKQLEHERVLAAERERIMRDMHDGVGGQLVTVLSLLQEQSGEIFRRSAERVSRSLIDLHFVIDSLDPEQYELPTLLGTMRMRLADQIEAAGIQLEWAVTDLPEVSGMTPTRCLHIMRIVQEAITNAIKHSGSATLRVETGASDSEVFIDVIDRGRGIGEVAKAGHGLKNMRYRASQLDAGLEIESSVKGTRVRLSIPL